MNETTAVFSAPGADVDCRVCEINGHDIGDEEKQPPPRSFARSVPPKVRDHRGLIPQPPLKMTIATVRHP